MHVLTASQQTEFIQLLDANRLGLESYVRALVGSKGEVDEVMQDLSITLWEKFHQFQIGTDFRRWACVVARYCVLTRIRDRSRESLVFDAGLLEQIADTALEGSRHAERLIALESCIQKLPVADRHLIRDVYHSGERVDLLARKQHRTSMSLYKRLRRIRLSLLGCIEATLKAEGCR